MRRTAALALLLCMCTALPPEARAAEQMSGFPEDPSFPLIPDVFDLQLSEDEWERIQDGEIITQIVERSADDRQARAIGYLKSQPIALFDIATDSGLAPEIVPEVEKVTVHEKRPRGKLFSGRADFSFVLPVFEYTIASAYDETQTGQAWAQVKGDFDKNEGSHSFFWDPVREETLSVMTFDFALKGLLSMVPEWIILRVAKQTLPDFMRSVDEMTVEMAERDPVRGARVAADWKILRADLEAGKYPSRLWQGYPLPQPPEVAVTHQSTVPEVDTTDIALTTDRGVEAASIEALH